MKKTYINPNMEVVKIATQQMLAGSPGQQTLSKTGDSISSDSEIGGHGDDFDW